MVDRGVKAQGINLQLTLAKSRFDNICSIPYETTYGQQNEGTLKNKPWNESSKKSQSC